MMKFNFNLLASLALIMLGTALILAGFHVLGAGGEGVLHQEISVATGTATATAKPTVSPAASVTPVASVSVTATAVPSGNNTGASAQVVSYGTDKDTYNRGDTAKGYIVIKNTGSAVINDVTVSASVARAVPALGTASLGSKDFKIGGLNIQPGETKRAEFSVNIPGEYSGFSTAGDYDLNGNVLVSGKQIGSFSKHIKVV